MKTLRNILGFALILIIVSGLGYIGWFVSKEQNISWSTIMGSKTVEDAHSQHTSTEASATKPVDVNPIGNLKGKVSTSYNSIQQVAELMSSSSVNPLMIQHYQRGLYSLSEGVYLMNQLNGNMDEMVRLTEATNPTYQVYVDRHNLLVQSKTILSNVSQKLSDAKDMFLSNVSVNEAGDSISPVDVQQANKAIYQMAQAVMELESTNQWLDNQINQTMVQAQQVQEAQAAQEAQVAMQAESASLGQTSGFSIGNVQMPTLVTLISILFTVLMLVGIIGAVRSLVVTKPQTVENEHTV
ncbi:MAG: hypothetical protein K6T94_26090 [Paenibacillus sp.]|nr:hypothetical protein [Paenibacillus sp.]